MQEPAIVSTSHPSLNYSHLFRQMFPMNRIEMDFTDSSQPTILSNPNLSQKPVQISTSNLIPDPPSYWRSFPQSAYHCASSRGNYVSHQNSALRQNCSSANKRPPELQKALHELAISKNSSTLDSNKSCKVSRTGQKQPFKLIPEHHRSFKYKSKDLIKYNRECSNSRYAQNHDRRRSSIVIHQIGDAEDHFSKALNTPRGLNGIRLTNAHNDSIRSEDSPRMVVTLNGNGSSDSERCQNIADLVVEQHFEKALANFQPVPPCLSPTLSLTESNFSFPKGPLDLSLRPQESEERSSSRSSLSDNSCCSSYNNFSFNPKKKWMEKYVQVGDPYWSFVLPETEVSNLTGSCPVLCSHNKRHEDVRTETELMDTTEKEVAFRADKLKIDVDSLYYPSSSPASFSEKQRDVIRSLKDVDSLSHMETEMTQLKRRSTISLCRQSFQKFGYLIDSRLTRQSEADRPIQSTSPTSTSGIFTDSNNSIDFTVPTASEADSNGNKRIGLTPLKEDDAAAGEKQSSFRKRTASDVSCFFLIKRSKATALKEGSHRLTMMELQNNHSIQKF